MGDFSLQVDNKAHLLHLNGRTFPCDRDIEAYTTWYDHALLLSSDTDCLSLWDEDGLIRTARVGVYPQDMAVQDDMALVCGGSDGMLHLLTLPDLHSAADYPLPGMPERVALHGHDAWLLTLLTDNAVMTQLLCLDLDSGTVSEVARFPGLPGAITAADSGLWIGISETVLHLPYGEEKADLVIDGLGLARRIDVLTSGVLIDDALEERMIFLRT